MTEQETLAEELTARLHVLIAEALRCLENAWSDDTERAYLACRRKIAYCDVLFHEREASRAAKVTLTEAEVEGLRDYVQWHGAAHAEGCPGDDTCDCACKPLNDAVNAICRKVFDAQIAEAKNPVKV